MDDLRSRFSSLARVPMPNLWPDIERRANARGTSGTVARVVGRQTTVRGAPLTSPLRRQSGLRLSWAVALGLLLITSIAAGGALIIGSRLPDPPNIVHGKFTETGPLTVDAGREIRVMSSLTLPDGRLLVIGTSLTRNAGDFAERPWAAVYEPTTGTFTETGAPSIIRPHSTLTALADGRVLLAGGSLTPDMFDDPEQAALADPASAEIWDPASGLFVRTGQMSVGRYGHTATLLPDGRVLLAGGDTLGAREGIEATAELYDPTNGVFQAVAGMTVARVYASAAQLSDGRVLVTGGYTGGSLSNSAELFDPSTQTFSVVGQMAVGRAEHTSTTLADGRVLVAGGGLLSSSGFLDGHATPTAELFDPATGAFEAVGSMTTERTQHAAVRVGDRVLVVGGQNIDGAPRTAELFDPATSTFLAAGRAPAGGSDTTASILPDGDVLVTADAAAPVLWAADDVAAPNPAPAGPAFSAVEWPTLRDRQTVTALADGRVLIAGGRDSRSLGPTAAAELFDPRTGATTAIQMQQEHFNHAAVRLGDGRVLIVGGVEREQAELFDPTSATFEATDAPNFATIDLGSGPPTSDATHALLLADGRVLVLAHANPGSWTRAAAIYDPLTETFGDTTYVECQAAVAPVRMLDDRVFLPCGRGTNQAIVYDPTGAMPIAIPGSTDWTNAALLPSGQVLVTSDSGDAALFDPQSMSFVTSQSSPMARVGAVAHPLADGRVLIVGGRAQRAEWSPLRNAELYDPSSGLFVNVGPMVDGRFGVAVEELADGRLLIVGGSHTSPDRTDPPASGAEIFDPTRVP